ncbi:MAG: glycosyltransferase [Deltaproteobacteria bacterium]|nr:glycosyltransferase [Deltaproteobacteria bacterium]
MKTEHLKTFPWATLGRPETQSDFWSKWQQQRDSFRLFHNPILFSILVVLPKQFSEETTKHHLEECFASLREQSYQHWETIIVGCPSSIRMARKLISADSRFKWIESSAHSATKLRNHALDHASGSWIGEVDWCDVLSPIALFQCALELQRAPETSVLYSNEAQLDTHSKKILRFLSKPNFSWFDLIHLNYIGGFWLVQNELLKRLRFDTQAGDHYQHDFFLRAALETENMKCVPRFLYYRRATFCPEIAQASLLPLINRHLKHKGITAQLSLHQNQSGSFAKISPAVDNPTEHLISAVICFHNQVDLTNRCLRSLVRARGKVPLEVWLINNGSSEAEVKEINNTIASLPFPVTMMDYPHAFNFAHMNNLIIKERCRGKYVLFLNNDVEWEEGSLDDLVSWLQFPWVGTVGILLQYPNGLIQYGGFRGIFGGHARIARIGHVREKKDFVYCGKEVFGNTFAACMVKKTTFDEAGGLRTLELANGFGDVVFNFECLQRGLKNLYLGHVRAVHLESASRGMSYEYWEEFALEREFPDILEKMLHFDLGYDRTPASDGSLRIFLKKEFIPILFEKWPGLYRVKPHLKRLVGRLLPILTH